MKNPFQNVGSPVFIDSEYVQRRTLFDRLVQHINEHTALGAVYGLPRIGKTSVVMRVCHHFKDLDPHNHFVYVDLDRVPAEKHFSRFWRDAQRKLGKELGMPIDEQIPLRDVNIERDCFLDMVEEVRDRGEFLVFVIDEFCTCLKFNETEADNFINDFRSMIGGDGISLRNLTETICTLIISRRTPKFIQSKTGGSTLDGVIGGRFPVGVLTPEEFASQCAMVPGMSEAESHRLEELTHRHPYVSALVDKVLYDEHCTVDVAWEKVSGIVSGYYDDVRKLIGEATEDGTYIPKELKDVVSSPVNANMSVAETKTRNGEVPNNSHVIPQGRLKELIQNGWRGIVYLHGQKGTGKTHFVREILEVLGIANDSEKYQKRDCTEWNGSDSADRAQHALFGYMKGAFTGADKPTAGILERAKDGVLFLDEICKLPVDVQNKLAQTIYERKGQRIGADGNKFDLGSAIIVFASWENPAEGVGRGTFSSDLWSRIKEDYWVAMPSLYDCRKQIEACDVENILSEVLDKSWPDKKVSFEKRGMAYMLDVLHDDSRIDFKPHDERMLPENWRLVKYLVKRLIERCVMDTHEESITLNDVKQVIDEIFGPVARVFENVVSDSDVKDWLRADGLGIGSSDWEVRSFCAFVHLVCEHRGEVIRRKSGYGKKEISRDVYCRCPREDGKVPGDPAQQYDDVLKNLGFDGYEKARDWVVGILQNEERK